MVDLRNSNTPLIEEQEIPFKYKSIEQALTTFACLSFFPLIYLIGNFVTTYLN